MIRIDPRDESVLSRYANDVQDQIRGKGVRSTQSAFEAQMEALSMQQRHQMASLTDGRGRFRLHGNDLRCGCTQHAGTGEEHEGGESKEIGISPAAENGVRFDSTVRRDLERADAHARFSSSTWKHPFAPSAVLLTRFGEVLTPALAQFDPATAGRAKKTLAMTQAKSRITRERVHLAAIFARAQEERGRGTIVHLTQAARAGHAEARLRGSRLSIEAWAEKLGDALLRGRATARERSLAAQMNREAAALELSAWGCYREGRGQRVPQRPSLAA